MPSQSSSDHIEAYIKAILDQNGIVELQRSQLAEAFQVVPSQINYVLKTRFTERLGYLVESKRGGRGYIRIARLTFSDQHQLLDKLLKRVGDRLSQADFCQLLAYLADEDLLTERELHLFSSIVTDDVLGQQAAIYRARMLCQLLKQLDRKK